MHMLMLFGYWRLELPWDLELGLELPDEILSQEQELQLAISAVKVASSSGALAQLVRALPCHGRGCGFEPRRLRGFYAGL